jgi:hypothetical protein
LQTLVIRHGPEEIRFRAGVSPIVIGRAPPQVRAIMKMDVISMTPATLALQEELRIPAAPCLSFRDGSPRESR